MSASPARDGNLFVRDHQIYRTAPTVLLFLHMVVELRLAGKCSKQKEYEAYFINWKM